MTCSHPGSVSGLVWAASPASTELETVVVDWLAELLGLPARFRTDFARRWGHPGFRVEFRTESTLLAALHRASGGEIRADGITRRYTLYVWSQTHSALEKAARITGIGADNMRVVDVDPLTLAMDPGHLRTLITEDIARAGAVPAMVCATAGTTATTAMDPWPRSARICADTGLAARRRRHVRGAAICPELRSLQSGLAGRRQLRTNPHKWLLTNFDCGLF